jgi:hypothetical protein
MGAPAEVVSFVESVIVIVLRGRNRAPRDIRKTEITNPIFHP